MIGWNNVRMARSSITFSIVHRRGEASWEGRSVRSRTVVGVDIGDNFRDGDDWFDVTSHQAPC
jgi:hypothetical protein